MAKGYKLLWRNVDGALESFSAGFHTINYAKHQKAEAPTGTKLFAFEDNRLAQQAWQRWQEGHKELELWEIEMPNEYLGGTTIASFVTDIERYWEAYREQRTPTDVNIQKAIQGTVLVDWVIPLKRVM
mgnify:CR=1 FL=1